MLLAGTLVALLGDWSPDRGATWAAGIGTFAAVTEADVTAPLSVGVVANRALVGAVAVPAARALNRVDVAYRWPVRHAFVSVLSDSAPSTRLAYTVPDLTSVADLCVEASALPGSISSRVCGAALAAAPTSLPLQPEPAFLGRVAGASLTPSTTWAWSAFDAGVLRARP